MARPRRREGDAVNMLEGAGRDPHGGAARPRFGWDLARIPVFPALLTAIVLIGFREAMSNTYLTLFAVDQARLGPVSLGALLTVRAGGAIAFSMLFGRWFDRRPRALPLGLSLVAGSLGYALLSATTNLGWLLVIVGVPLGVGSSAFPLIFALARTHLVHGHPMEAARRMAVLRAGFSAAWGIGPAVGAVAVGIYGYDGLFWASAAFSLLAWVPLGLGIRTPTAAGGAAGPEDAPRAGRAVLFAASSLTVFALSISAGAVALPIVLTNGFGADKSAVGLASSLCALLEVPLMAAIAARPALFPGFRGMAVGFVATAAYFLAVTVAPSVPAILAAQALRAVSIGLISCLGIGYLQDLMPNRAGAAAALYANTSQIGNLLAGIAAGLWAHAFGYASLFWACMALAVAGLALLALGRRG